MKMKRLTLILAVIPLMLSLAGCFQVDQEIYHNPDGTGRIDMNMGLSIEFLEMMGNSENPLPDPLQLWKDLQNDPAHRENLTSFTSREYEADGMHHYTMQVEMKDIAALTRESRTAADFTVTLLDNGNYRFSQKIDLGSGEQFQQADPAMLANMMKDKYWTVRLHVPRVISADSRATIDEENNVVEWKLPMARILTASQPTEFWLEYSLKPASAVPWLWIGIGAGGLLLIAAALFFFLRRKRPASPARPEPPAAAPE